MRKGYSDYGTIIENGIFYGISLGFDFCSEHEWGIKKLQEKLGINSEKMGVDGRTVSTNDKSVIFVVEGNQAVLITKPWRYEEREPTFENVLNRELKIDDYFNSKQTDESKKDLATAWDENSFGILVQGDKNIAYLKELYESFKTNNIVFAYIGENNVFNNSSLSVLIKDKLPQEVIDQMYTLDKKVNDLIEYEKEIGITNLKEKAKKNSSYQGEKYYCACSPKWINYEDEKLREDRKKELKTKYDICYWVNYSDDDNNYGWYNAEEIIKWLSTPGLKLTQIRKAN